MSGSSSPTGPMMNFDDIKLPGSQNGTPQPGTEKKQRPDTKYWCNVGIERGGKFIPLPMGIPLDNLKPRNIPGPKTKNQEFRNVRIAEKQLLEAVQSQLGTFTPGETRRVQFVVEIHMVDEKTEISEDEIDENPFAVGELKL